MGRRGSKRSNVASEPAASKSEAEDKSKNKEDSSAEAMEVTNAEDSCKITTLSKTTFKLRSESAMTSEDDLSLELMEIPLSPTHYDQPPTPDHEPPSAFEAETAILSVLDNIRKVGSGQKLALTSGIFQFLKESGVRPQVCRFFSSRCMKLFVFSTGREKFGRTKNVCYFRHRSSVA